MHIFFPLWGFAQWEKLRHNPNLFLVSGKIASSYDNSLPVHTYITHRYSKLHHSVLIGNPIFNTLFSFIT